MKHYLNRRQFMTASACTVTSFTLGFIASCRSKELPKRGERKALIVEKPTESVLRRVSEAGFGGIEAMAAAPIEAEKIRKMAEGSNLRIHSVLRGWAQFNSKDKDEVEKSLVDTVNALHAAKAYGADAVLLVPGKIGGMAMPQPWEFRVTFDEKTGHIAQVTEQDDGRYADYIAAHNHAYDAGRNAILRLISEAEKAGVIIAVENVWNNLFVDPRHMAHFIDSFESPWVRAYFDIANHLKYSPPEQWIKTLNRRIVRCHVKDFKLNEDGHGGKFVDIRDGSIDWPLVTRALADAGYSGWMTIEGSDKLSLEDRSKRLDLILAGK
jgi:hexulose-6-phosphate isomerase